MNIILILGILMVLVLVILFFIKKHKKNYITTTTTFAPVSTSTTTKIDGPVYYYYMVDTYICGTCKLIGTGDYIKSLDELVVGQYYNDLDGFVYFISNSFGQPTSTEISGKFSAVDCKTASAYGC